MGLRFITMSPLFKVDQIPDMDHFWKVIAGTARASVFMPDDMAKMMFWEVYALGMPIWTPGPFWLSRMVPFFNYYHFSHKHLKTMAGEAVNSVGQSFPDEPFGLSGWPDWTREDQNRAMLRALFWVGLSDFVRYPHVQNFESVPQLLSGLLACDLGQISAGMKEAHAERVAINNQRWSTCLKLFGV